MARPQSPLVGYNTNVRHRGKLYHIQTEDSGINHPHVITHLFADGGRIIASRKTSYAEHVGAEDLPNIVRKLMQEQHKGIFIQLRDCAFDEDESGAADDGKTIEDRVALDEGAAASLAGASLTPEAMDLAARVRESDLSALDRAAEQKAAGSAAARAQQAAAARGKGRYRQTVAAQGSTEPPAKVARPAESIFGGQLLKGKSLDEVILSYLADDLSEGDR